MQNQLCWRVRVAPSRHVDAQDRRHHSYRARRHSVLFALVCSLVMPSAFHSVVAADPFVQAKFIQVSDPKPADVEIRDFDVRVDDKVTGTHRLTIKADDSNQEVSFHTDVKMDYFVYAYTFKFRGTEVWSEGRLKQTKIHCEDGGKKRTFDLKTDGGIQQISFNGKSAEESTTSAMTTAYWKLPPAELRAKPFPIVDVDTGRIREAHLNLVGKASISMGNRVIECQHFKIEGPSPAELWFDHQDRLVRQKSVEQGHLMELRLKQIRLALDDR